MTDVVIVDFSWMFYRSFHAMNEMQWVCPERGVIRTGGIYGTINAIHRLNKAFKCHILVATEPPDNSFREELEPEYKAGRNPPDDIMVCWDDAIRTVMLLPFASVVSARTGEADDVIYTLVKQCLPHSQRILLAANDNDLMQVGQFEGGQDKVLFVGNKHVLTPLHEKLSKAFQGVAAKDLAVYRAIVGDKSDNLAGPIPRFATRVARRIAENFENPQAFQKHHANLGPMDATESKYVRLLLQETNFNHWLKNYNIMKMQDVEVIYPDLKELSLQEAMDRYGLMSLNRMLGISLADQDGPTLSTERVPSPR